MPAKSKTNESERLGVASHHLLAALRALGEEPPLAVPLINRLLDDLRELERIKARAENGST